jgi:ribosome recycling factor
MTLERTTKMVLAAVELQDLGTLEAAGKERAAAIAGLGAIPPTPELRQSLTEALAAGEEARRSIRLIRHRLRKESRRLEKIETGFLGALRLPPRHRVDCSG